MLQKPLIQRHPKNFVYGSAPETPQKFGVQRCSKGPGKGNALRSWVWRYHNGPGHGDHLKALCAETPRRPWVLGHPKGQCGLGNPQGHECRDAPMVPSVEMLDGPEHRATQSVPLIETPQSPWVQGHPKTRGCRDAPKPLWTRTF